MRSFVLLNVDALFQRRNKKWLLSSHFQSFCFEDTQSYHDPAFNKYQRTLNMTHKPHLRSFKSFYFCQLHLDIYLMAVRGSVVRRRCRRQIKQGFICLHLCWTFCIDLHVSVDFISHCTDMGNSHSHLTTYYTLEQIAFLSVKGLSS